MTQSATKQGRQPSSGIKVWGRPLFVPIATLVLVVAVAHWVDARLNIDLITAAQNDRLTFQTSGTAENVVGLSPHEIDGAASVLDRERSIPSEQVQVLYLGNSQTMAIMDRRPGDLTTPQWLHVLLGRRGSPGSVRLGSLPNMSSAEMLLRLTASAENQPRPQCDVVVIALVLEEFRGVGIRPEMEDVARRPAVRERLSELLKSNPDLAAAGRAMSDLLTQKDQGDAHAADSVTAAKRTWTDQADEKLGTIADQLPYVAKRDKVVGLVSVSYMEVRNKVLGITTASARPVPEPTYRASAELVELMLRYAKQRNIGVVVYLAPMRPIKPNPNVPADVDRFRREMPELCAKYGAACVDFVDLVPEQLWTNYEGTEGPTGGQRDFAHFTGAAHKLVAETIAPIVESAVARAKGTTKQGPA